MIEFERERVRANVREATTEDLLDRATLYREGMEPEALEIIEAELCRRGVSADQVAAHAARPGAEVVRLPDGTPARCSLCDRPAVARAWGWHRLQGTGPAASVMSLFSLLLRLLPLYRPRRLYYCAAHRPANRGAGPTPR
jgi:hypothetical protein